MKRVVYIGMAVVVLAGCGKPESKGYVPKEVKAIPVATVEAGKEDVLLPATVGNRWRYETQRVSQLQGQTVPQQEEIFLEVKSVETTPEGKRFAMEVIKNDVAIDRQVWETRKDGIFEMEVGMDDKVYKFNPPAVACPFPVEVGKEFEREGEDLTQLGKFPGKTKGVILEPDEVDCGIGRLSAIHVQQTKNFKVPNGEGEEITDAWYAPNIGIVRLIQTTKLSNGAGTVFKMTLKDYNVR